jgi:CheY-like chemotaxis protein
MSPENPNLLMQDREDLLLHVNTSKDLDVDPGRILNRDRSFLVQDWRVLHIEDDDGDAYLLVRALDQAGIRAWVHRCLDSEEGLLFLREQLLSDRHWPDVVLLDLNTPRMNGWEFLTAINADQTLRGLQVEIVTSSSLPEDRQRAAELGANGFHTKPDGFDELVHIMERIFAAPVSQQSSRSWKNPELAALPVSA